MLNFVTTQEIQTQRSKHPRNIDRQPGGHQQRGIHPGILKFHNQHYLP